MVIGYEDGSTSFEDDFLSDKERSRLILEALERKYPIATCENLDEAQTHIFILKRRNYFQKVSEYSDQYLANDTAKYRPEIELFDSIDDAAAITWRRKSAWSLLEATLLIHGVEPVEGLVLCRDEEDRRLKTHFELIHALSAETLEAAQFPRIPGRAAPTTKQIMPASCLAWAAEHGYQLHPVLCQPELINDRTGRATRPASGEPRLSDLVRQLRTARKVILGLAEGKFGYANPEQARSTLTKMIKALELSGSRVSRDTLCGILKLAEKERDEKSKH